MRTRNFLFTALLLSGLAFTSCNDDNDDNYTPDTKIVEALNSRYPNAQRVEWEQKHDHYVAEFYLDGVKREAWINPQGEWTMTESDILYKDLPAEIQAAFEASEYKDWKKEDVDLLERVDMDPIYVIEVEKGKVEFDLYYSQDGTLIKAVEDIDNDDVYIPTTVSEALKTFINTRYPGAIILDMDIERNFIEIDIRHESKYKDVIFNLNNEWISTSWDVRKADVPKIVLDNINNRYSGYAIDDIEYEERADGTNVYIFELEQNDREIKITIDTEGNIIE